MLENTLRYNGTYTLVNKESGTHRTFKVTTNPDDSRFAPGKRVIALLDGPDNESDYLGFGFVTDEGIAVWGKKRGTATEPSFFEKSAKAIWDLGTKGEASRYASKMELLIEARCRVCNRKLTTPESIESGIGPTCAGR